MWRAVPAHLKRAVVSHLRRTPRFRSFEPVVYPDDVYVRLALAAWRGELFVANTTSVNVYASANPGDVLRTWPVDPDGSVSPVNLGVDEPTGQVLVTDHSSLYLFASDGAVLAHRTELSWTRLILGYDFATGELYMYNGGYVEVETLDGQVLRRWTEPRPRGRALSHLTVLGEGLLLAATLGGMSIHRSLDGTVIRSWLCASVRGLGVHANTVYALCGEQMRLFRLFDGACVGSWPSFGAANLNTVAVAHTGQICLSDGYRVLVSQ